MKALNAAETSLEPVDIRTYVFGPFRVETASHQLLRDHEPVALAPKAFDTLVVLLRLRDRVVGKDELMRAVWRDAFVGEDSLTQSIWGLRRALGDSPAQPQYIATVPRRGYRFIANVQELHTGADPTSPADSARIQTSTVAAVPAPVDAGESGPTGLSLAPGLRRPQAVSATGAGVWRWAVAGAVAGATLVGLISIAARTPASPPGDVMRFVQSAPLGTALTLGGALSPDGRHLAFVARDEASGRSRLWLRALDQIEAKPLAGTDDAARPFWSPDGQFIAFFAEGRLKSIGRTGEPIRTITTVGARSGSGSWGTGGVIVWADRRSGLFSVPATGGAITPVTTLDPSGQDGAHRWPAFLPDGRHFLYAVTSTDAARAGTYVGSLDSPERVRLLENDNTPAIYAAPGYLLYVREGALIAHRFDATRLALSGTEETIATNVPAPSLTSGASLSASASGVLALGGGSGTERLAWFSRMGESLGTVATPATLHNIVLSADGTMLVGDSVDANRRGVWLVDLARGAATRLRHDGIMPTWSPDGSRIAFTASPSGIGDVFVRAATGESGDERIVSSPDAATVEDWSRDGRYLVYSTANRNTRQDLWIVPTTAPHTPQPFLRTPSNEMFARVSPDGKWIAYMSDESGDWEVYLQTFPTPGQKRTISVGGGSHPQWRGDGHEMFYLAADRSLMAVSVTLGTSAHVGQPRPLFRTHVTGDATAYRTPYAATADGSRFLIDSIDEAAEYQPIEVMVNWMSRLAR